MTDSSDRIRMHRILVTAFALGLGVCAACADDVTSGVPGTPDASRRPAVDAGEDGGEEDGGEEDATIDDDAGVPIEAGPRADAGILESGSDATNDRNVLSDSAGVDAMPVAMGALVINEIDYDQVMTDSAEYVEIYNPSPTATVDMSNLALVFANGSGANQGEYFRQGLSGNLLPLHYLVLAAPGVAVTNPLGASYVTVLRFVGQNNNIQNGDPDGVAIVDTTTNRVVDALSYGGALSTPYAFVEGTPTAVKDTNDGGGAMIRDPNGRDTNNAVADWKLSSSLTPGAPNLYTP